jgi:molybdate transport system ATP-binding protein
VSDPLSIDVTVPLDRFTLSIAWKTSNRFLGLFGPSGSGKTTLLETLAGVRHGARGVVRIHGRTWLDTGAGIDWPPERRGVGYVPQEALLFPHRNVLGNVLSGRRRASRTASPPPERVLQVLELGDLAGRDVATLSGGERRRVALGRALCSGPGLLLLDEPLAALDRPLRRRILEYLMLVREEFALPTLYVSHDATEIRVLCDEVAVLSSGRLIDCGRPDDLFARPTILPLTRTDGFENVLRGRVTDLTQGAAIVEIEPGLRLVVPEDGLVRGREATIGLRADDLILSIERPAGLSAQNILPAVIREIREPGENDRQMMVVLEIGQSRSGPVLVAITRQAFLQLDLRPGRAVHLIAKAQACRLLAAG